jgi:hypothetical protein
MMATATILLVARTFGTARIRCQTPRLFTSMIGTAMSGRSSAGAKRELVPDAGNVA